MKRFRITKLTGASLWTCYDRLGLYPNIFQVGSTPYEAYLACRDLSERLRVENSMGAKWWRGESVNWR